MEASLSIDQLKFS